MFSAALLTINAGHALPLLRDVAVKGLLVSASALATLLCLRRASAATRHLVLLAGMGVLLGLPVLMALLPRQEFPRPAPAPRAAPAAVSVPALPAPMAPSIGDAAAAPVPAPLLPTAAPISEAPTAPLDAAPVVAPPSLPAPPAVTPAPAPSPPIRPGWLVLGWLVGVLACAARMLAAQARVWRLTRRCPPLPASLLLAVSLETAPFAALLTGPAGTPPMVWGWPRAVLLLPPEAADWPDARRRAVVLHESAHVRRCDWLTHLLAQAVCALYWFNPLLWLLAARLGAEAERACDDAVLLAGVPPTDYAQDLLAVARHLGAGRATRRVSVGAVTMARRSPVRGRLEAILDTRRARRRVTRRSAALALAAAFAVATPLAVLRPAARADEGRVPQAAPTPGVPTEADIAKVQQHLQRLEQARADYAAAHPNTLTAAQIKTVDWLIGGRERKRRDKEADASMAAQNEAAYKRALVEAKKPHTKEERRQIWGTIFGHINPGPDRGGKIVAERERIRNLRNARGLAQLERQVAVLPADQKARETSLYAFGDKIALDETQIEAMQMERAEGYPMHFAQGDILTFARTGLRLERSHFGSRADWVLIELLNTKLHQEKHLDDADVDSLIALLREPGDTPSMNLASVLSLFRDMHGTKMAPVPASQQQKIRLAVTPFLTSHNKWPKLDILEHKFAREVLDLYGGSAPPPAQKAQAVPAVLHQAALLRAAAFAPPAADEGRAGQAAPMPGVPTETDIAQARQHLHDLEKARADYAAAHQGTLSPTQIIEQGRAKTALRMEIIQLEKSMLALDLQGPPLRTPAVVAFEEKRHQREEQTDTDEDQIRSADAKSVLYPAQAAHWKQTSANASARIRRRQAEVRAMRPPTAKAAAEVARYDDYQKASGAALRRWMQLDITWHVKYAPRRLPEGASPVGVRGLPPGAALPNPAGQERAENALRLQIIQLQKARTALQRQMKASEKAFRDILGFANFDRKRRQLAAQINADKDQRRAADAKAVSYPAQAAHWKEVSAKAAARARLGQAEIQAMRSPTEGTVQVAQYQRCQEAFNTAYKQLQDLQLKLALLRLVGRRSAKVP